MSILFQVDGETYPPDDCSWYMTAPCGCYCAVTLAGFPEILATEEQAWKSFYPRAGARRDKQDDGYGMELGLTKDVREKLADCPHKPKYRRPEEAS